MDKKCIITFLPLNPTSLTRAECQLHYWGFFWPRAVKRRATQGVSDAGTKNMSGIKPQYEREHELVTNLKGRHWTAKSDGKGIQDQGKKGKNYGHSELDQ